MFEKVVRELFRSAGVQINGTNPCDPQVWDNRFYERVLREGSLGLGESYMAGWWDCQRLDELFYRLVSSGLYKLRLHPTFLWFWLRMVISNQAGRRGAFQLGKSHYDLGNSLFERMLDRRLVYTCGYWPEGVVDLDSAQEAKLNLVCQKLALRPGQRVLDIGCGFGSFLKFAAENYGIEGVGVTVSLQQQELAQKLCQRLPIQILLQDYRDLAVSTPAPFDRIVSLGMFEHVEPQNYRQFMKIAHNLLKEDGLFLLHTIGKNSCWRGVDPWIRKYIFPVGIIPCSRWIGRSAGGLFEILDWHAFGGAHYQKTLLAWHENFSRYWPKLRDEYAYRVGGKFERMWRYFLLSCAGMFAAGRMDVWQIVLAKGRRDYRPIR